jgi:hypothetical protein
MRASMAPMVDFIIAAVPSELAVGAVDRVSMTARRLGMMRG